MVGAVDPVTFSVPDWAIHATVDLSMDPAQWPRFTDFGLTLFDSAGRQLGKSPLNYALGRLHVELAGTGLVRRSRCGSFRAWRTRRATRRWTASLSIRLYADSARVERLPGSQITLPPGGTGSVHVALPSQSHRSARTGLRSSGNRGSTRGRPDLDSGNRLPRDRARRSLHDQGHRAGGGRPGLLGRLARGPGASGRRRPDRLPHDGLPRRGDHVHHAEAEVARSQRGIRPRFRSL